MAVEEFGELAAVASLRKPAWRSLGTCFDGPVTTSKMLTLSLLANWNLRFVDAADIMKDYHFNKPTKHIVRDNPFKKGQMDVLGTVGKRYNIFSNEEILNFGDLLTDGNRRWETAGSINGGSRIFATLAEPNDIILDPGGSADRVSRYTMLTSSHDGSSTLLMKKVNTRVDCANTLGMAMREISDEFCIRHTVGMQTKLEDAKLALGFAKQYDDAFEVEMQKLIETQMTKDKFVKLVESIYPKPEDNARGRETKWEYKRDAILTIWEDGTGSMKNLDDTAWKALNTLTEHQQWFREVREDKVENFYKAGAGFDNVANSDRQDIFNRVLATV